MIMYMLPCNLLSLVQIEVLANANSLLKSAFCAAPFCCLYMLLPLLSSFSMHSLMSICNCDDPIDAANASAAAEVSLS